MILLFFVGPDKDLPYECMLCLFDIHVHTRLILNNVLNQIKAAYRALRNVENLPIIRMPENKYKSVNDILEWLYLVFGFQVSFEQKILFTCSSAISLSLLVFLYHYPSRHSRCKAHSIFFLMYLNHFSLLNFSQHFHCKEGS